MKLFNTFLSPLWLIETFLLLRLGGDDDKPDYIPVKPVNMQTGFANATADAENGNYNYTLSPELAQMRDYFYKQANQSKMTPEQQAYAQQVGDTGQSFFNRGSNMDLAGESSDYYNSMMRLMDPQRTQENANYADSLFKSGRTGAGIGMDQGYINPEQYALAKAREQQNSEIAMGSQDRARQIQQSEMQMGLGLADSANALAMRPYQNTQSLFGVGTGIEGLGMNVMNSASNAVTNQMNVQGQRQAYENATVDSGKGGLGGLIGTAAGAYFGGPAGAQIGGAIGGAVGGGGQTRGGQLASTIGNGLSNGFSSLWSGSSPNSGLGSIFGSAGGYGGDTGTPFAMNRRYGTGFSTSLGGNTVSPNYSMGPSW
jgi:hypothetical protein